MSSSLCAKKKEDLGAIGRNIAQIIGNLVSVAAKKTPSGWKVDVQPGGRGKKRYRKTFERKADAVQWEKRIHFQASQASVETDLKPDDRSMVDLVNLWYDLHGLHLKSSLDTKKRLLAICQAVGNPFARDFNAKRFVDYRSARLAQGTKPATLNRERATLFAMFSELSRSGHWTAPNPLDGLRAFKVDRVELTFLDQDQISRLFESLAKSTNPDVELVATVSLSTGARWSEAQALSFPDVQAAPGLVTFRRTKGGKSRSVPVSDQLAVRLRERLSKGRFCSCYSAFRSAIERSGIDLPAGQLAHVLRHTFASHFIKNSGDLLTLQRALGHSSLTVTMVYAHLSPGFLDQVRRFNPLANS
jgi:integrase